MTESVARHLVYSVLGIGVVCVLFLFSNLGNAQVMQSENYRLESDSVNLGGGRSSSDQYTLESTVGEIATGESGSDSFNLYAGYQQLHTAYIAISGGASVTMDTSIPGISGGVANGSTSVVVITDSPSGYALTIAASQSPALQKGGDSIADYVPLGDPDYYFVIDATDAHFGYTPEGADIVARFRNDGGENCNAGSTDTPEACWDGLHTTAETIASATSANHPAGATTTLRFRVGIGGAVAQPPGVYTATTTLTAYPL